MAHLEQFVLSYDGRVDMPLYQIKDFVERALPPFRLRWHGEDDPSRKLGIECDNALWRVSRNILKHPPVDVRKHKSWQARVVRELVEFAAESSLRSPKRRELPHVRDEDLLAVLCGLDQFEGSLPEQLTLLYWCQTHTQDYTALLRKVASPSTAGAHDAVDIVRLIASKRTTDSADVVIEQVRALLQQRGYHRGVVHRALSATHLWLFDHSYANVDASDPIILGDLCFKRLSMDSGALDWDTYWTNWLTFGTDFEVLHDKKHVFLMRQPPTLEPCPELESLAPIDDIVWDGHYLWIARKRATDAITVMDPRTHTIVARLSQDDGLPSSRLACKLAPLGVGKVFVAGAFGRTWLATVELPRATGGAGSRHARITVLHRATKVADIMAKSEAQAVDVAFLPWQVFAVPRVDASEPWIIVRRNVQVTGCVVPPLLVDLAKGGVSALPDPWRCSAKAHVEPEGVLLPNFRKRYSHMVAWCHPPAFRVEPDDQHAYGMVLYHSTGHSCNPPAYSVREGKKLHMVAEAWLTLDLETGQTDRCVKMPRLWWFGGLVNSQFYGLVRYATNGLPRGPFQVSFLSNAPSGSSEKAP